ncbi:MAG: cupredoxin domain-containing protein [Chloroflexi bacterium]|nr:cupredoxin domain-containing protein [Chloroflexota bacterium]
MARERGRRRRGHRRGRSEGPSGPQRPEDELSISEESEAPGVLPSRFSFRLRRRREERERAEPKPKRPARERAPEKAVAGATPADTSPLSFWRRGQARTYREQPLPRRGPARWWRRLTGFYFPPWVPVVAIIIVVFGILGLLFFTRAATGAPRIGQDHWHATYQTFICGERQPNVPTWEAGVHTHADGVIHIHPFTPSEEGNGARLVKWFEYGGGKLTKDELRLPGSRKEYKNGDQCPDGRPGIVQIFVNGERMADFSRYIPRDGDRVRMVFGPEEQAPVQQADRTIIAESQATRTVELEVSGDEAATAFAPASIEVDAGETVKLLVTNVAAVSHGVRVAGTDAEYETTDDYVSNPDIIEPGLQGVVVVKFDTAGEIEFKDPTANDPQTGEPFATGKIVVKEAAATATPEPTGAAEPVDVTFDVTMGDGFFEPKELTIDADQKFRINLVNSGKFVHNLRIAGPDGQYETDDDLVSPDLRKTGDTGELVGQLDEPGTYAFRDDFNRSLMTGTITIR